MSFARFSWWFCAAFGAGLLVWAAVLSWSMHRFVARAQVMPGKVVELIPVRSKRGADTYDVLVRYVDAKGEPRTIAGGYGLSRPAHQVGDAVGVLRDPLGEYGPRIGDFLSLHAKALIVGACGTVLAVIGGSSLIPGRRQGRGRRTKPPA